ncbi:MAG: tRNA uridine-5-carboxymethylaminomethyl(34) synthesis GTPase MnmE [Firmicutes bacterium]|nr:tRNA uridine-5-carboxymethylaminomethyl(34) synthesis GTPase MnmE [Bacillota bacterium]
MQSSNTIVAIATPIGNAGVGIIRLSGPNAMDIVSRCFVAFGNVKDLTPRLAAFGRVTTPDFSDTVLCIYFPAPNSFTGEDVIEIQAHGGAFLLQKIVDHLVSIGATPAQPGEFSKRAFLNGKMSLDQAESIIETIHAESESHLKASSIIYSGKLKEQLSQFETELVQTIAQIEATMDYPEHDIEHTTRESIKPQIKDIVNQIDSLVSTAQHGRIIAHGVQIAVLGRPNVGKSSLFNQILGTDRSIVTTIEGTTTDTVSEAILYKGLRFVFNDTAGIRNAKNEIEKLGIERTNKVINDADIVLSIFDISQKPNSDDRNVLELSKDKNSIIILNKSDLVNSPTDWNKFLGENAKIIRTSALTGKNINLLKETIHNIATQKQPKSGDVVITNTRHLAQLNIAKDSLTRALGNIDTLPLDCIANDITQVIDAIGEITGTRASDAIIDEIFSRFCIGK